MGSSCGISALSAKRWKLSAIVGRTAIKVRRAWFECGSHSNNLWLAMVAGWTERRNAKGAWLCPQCTHRNVRERQGSPERLDLRVVWFRPCRSTTLALCDAFGCRRTDELVPRIFLSKIRLNCCEAATDTMRGRSAMRFSMPKWGSMGTADRCRNAGKTVGETRS